jgi:hypothetical protein
MKLLGNSANGSPSFFTVKHSEQKLHDEITTYQVQQKAHAKIRKAGLPKPERYTKNDEPLDPKLDLKLATIDNGALGRLMAEFTAACEYAAYAAACADIDKTVAENVLEFVEAKTRLSKSGTVQLKSDKTKIDPRVIAARSDFMEREAIAKLTAVILKNYERGLSTISREITRRQNEWDRNAK